MAITLLTSFSVSATTFTDLKFGQYQTADSQWNTSSCYYNPSAYNGCQIYSKNPGTTYKIPWYSGQVQWAAGDYIQFSASGDANYPWEAKQYDANGNVKTVLGTGKVIYSGLVNADGYFFFMGNDNNTGQLFSLSQGMDNTGGVTFSGEANPDTATLDNYAANYGSTTPLAQGESAEPSGGGGTTEPPAPTCGGSSDSSVTCDQATKSDLQYYDNHAGRKSDWEGIDTGTENIVRIEQIGDGNILEIDQTMGWTGGGNLVMGRSTTDDTATIIGDYNSVDLYQYGNDNVIGLDVAGNNNAVSGLQSGNGMRMRLIVEGDGNYASAMQFGNNNREQGQGHFADIKQSGDNNFASTYQWDENQLLVVDVGANNTMVLVDQQGGENYSSTVVGNDYTYVDLDQRGGGDHGANINLTGTSNTNLTLTQDSSTTQLIDITNHCVTANGCSVTVNQN